jgi:hypothetical protein
MTAQSLSAFRFEQTHAMLELSATRMAVSMQLFPTGHRIALANAPGLVEF